MSLARRALAAILIFIAAVGELIFAGGQVAMCLGPLGVTPIQCAKATGIVPITPIAVPLFALALASGVLLLAPIPAGRRRTAVVAGAIAAGAAGIAFVVLSPRTWTGVDSAGAPVSIDLPFDIGALATVVVIAATVGALAWAHLVAPRLARFERGPTH
jgi:hypothetical protein